MTNPRKPRKLAALAFALIVSVAACSNDGDGAEGRDSEAEAGPTTTARPTPPAPTTTVTLLPSRPPPERGVFEVGDGGVELLADPGGTVVGRIREGVLLPYDALSETFGRVTTPCDNVAWVDLREGEARGPVPVVIDPGHGGEEPGAVGPTGLTEAEVNLDIVRSVVEFLDEAGIASVVTRTGDYRATLAFRVLVGIEAGAEVFVSVHHNAEPDEERATPGTEAYYQIRSDESKRLTGLIQEEVFQALSRYEITFGADFDAGAKYRLSDEGTDYYGILRRSFDGEVVATLVESAFISNPDEEALLRRPEVRRGEARAIARGIERYFAGDQPGEVFTTPYPRTTPAGGGGGREGCVDPA